MSIANLADAEAEIKRQAIELGKSRQREATLRAEIEVLKAENLGMAADVITLAIAKGDAGNGKDTDNP